MTGCRNVGRPSMCNNTDQRAQRGHQGDEWRHTENAGGTSIQYIRDATHGWSMPSRKSPRASNQAHIRESLTTKAKYAKATRITIHKAFLRR